MNLSYEQWIEQYKPITPPGEFRSYDGLMLETYGLDADTVQTQQKHYPKTVWTLLEEDGAMWIGAGFHWVNRMGHFITEVPFDDEDIEIPLCESDEDRDDKDELEE